MIRTEERRRVATAEGGRLGTLYEAHAPEAARLAFLLTGDRALAEDLVHEAFVRLFGRFRDLRHPEAFRSYLRTTVVNLARSHFRRRRVERAYLEREGPAPEAAAPDPGGREEMWNALQRLAPRQRAAIVLRYYEDLTEAQTAEVLGCAVGTVKSLVARGLERLRRRSRGVNDVDLKTILDEKAEEMRLDRRIPRLVLRRARRRRAGTAALTGAVTVGLALGAVVGARALLVETTPGSEEDIRRGLGGATEEFYPFIYPPTQDELEVTREQVEQGSMPMWTEPEGAAILFAVNVMGWDMDDVEASVRGDEPVTVMITNPALNEAAGATADLRTAVSLARVPGSDPPMYAVLAARAEGMEVEPVGPDAGFGSGGTVAFRGHLSHVPDGALILLTVEQRGTVSAHGLSRVEADGTFQVGVEPSARIGPQSLVSIAVLEGEERRTLALTSSRIATPVVGATESGASEPELAIPGPVAETRDAIMAAAQARDFDALRALIPDEGFTFTFGGETDPIRYWKRLESEGHVPVIGDLLPMVLGTKPGFDRGVFVWPAQAVEDPAEWDERDVEALTAIHAEEDIRSFQQAGLYLGWRVGIDRDGTWVFFVAGD